MLSISETTISSSEGRRPIPLIGLGMATGTESADEVKAGVIEAIKVGYRDFDTATLYGTEKPLGEAIKEALRLGLISSRAELFTTTKLWCDSTEGDLVLPAINQSLRMYGKEWKCQNLGFTKSIGISNFSPRLIEQILSFAQIPPAVNQVEMNPLWQQKKLNEFCKKNDILLTGYSPLGAFGTTWGHNRVMECDVLQDIAKSKGKTIAQVCLRWMYEQGVSFVVKSFNSERMRQNVDIFDWSLTEEESTKVSRIPQQKHIYLSGSMLNEPHDVLAEIDGFRFNKSFRHKLYMSST